MKTAIFCITLILLTSCTTTQTEIVKPSCTVPPQPALPVIDAGDLWLLLGQERYDDLALREQRIVSWALEMQAMLGMICAE